MAAYGNSKESEVDRLKSRVNMLEDSVSKLRQELRTLQAKVMSASVPMEITKSGTTEPTVKSAPAQAPAPVTIPAREPEKTIQNFYLSTPNSDGSFNNSSANPSYKEGASIYKFQNTKDNLAKFKIDEHDASVKLALLYPDKNIDPVCDALNAFDPKARKIYTVENGIAELIGDKWKVTTKARIRYES